MKEKTEGLNDMNETLEKLKYLTSKHDWFYTFSDDHSVWKKGKAEYNEIMRLADLCRQQGFHEEVKELFKLN